MDRALKARSSKIQHPSTRETSSGAGNAFRLATPTLGRDDLHLGAGCALVISDRITAYAYYDGQFFRTNYDASTVTAGFRVSF